MHSTTKKKARKTPTPKTVTLPASTPCAIQRLSLAHRSRKPRHRERGDAISRSWHHGKAVLHTASEWAEHLPNTTSDRDVREMF